MSTSNSNTTRDSSRARVPAGSSYATWFGTLAAAVLLLAAWEMSARAKGIFPHGVANPPSAYDRYTASCGKAAEVIVHGTSRIALGIDPESVETELGALACVKSLGISHGSPIDALRYEATHPRDQRVAIVVDVTPTHFFLGLHSGAWAATEALLQRPPLHFPLERHLSRLWQNYAASSNESYTPVSVLEASWAQALGAPLPAPIGADGAVHESGWVELTRYHSPQSALDTQAERWARETEEAFDLSQRRRWPELLTKLKAWVQSLEASGTRVFFIRPPSSGAMARYEARVFPRSVYWESLAEAFPGASWHFADFPETRELATPDGSHLLSDGAIRYSRWLGRTLRATLERSLSPAPSLGPARNGNNNIKK